MPNYDSTARVPFKHGGSVKKPEVKRIILWKGKAKDWPGAKKAAEQLRNKKADGGKLEAYKKEQERKGILKKEKKWIASPGKRRKTGKRQRTIGKDRKINPQWLEEKYNVELKADGGIIDFKHGGKINVKKVSSRRHYGEMLKNKGYVKTRKEKQADYIKKHGKPEPRRKTLAVTDKYKKIRDSLGLKKGGKVKSRDKGGDPIIYPIIKSLKERIIEGKYPQDLRPLRKPRRSKKAEGGIISLKKGGKADKKWIQKATKGMRKDKPCTGKKFGSATCPPGSKRYNLAKTFKKMARSKHASGDMVRYI